MSLVTDTRFKRERFWFLRENQIAVREVSNTTTLNEEMENRVDDTAAMVFVRGKYNIHGFSALA